MARTGKTEANSTPEQARPHSSLIGEPVVFHTKRSDGKEGKGGDIVFTQHDPDLQRLEEPWLDEVFPIDHRTALGTLGGMQELLGFARLPIVQKHLGEHCRLSDVRNWLRKRNIDGRDINWTDFCALLQDSEVNGDRGGKPTDRKNLDVASRALHVSRSWLQTRIENNKLTTYRPGGKNGTGPHIVSLAEAAALVGPHRLE